MEYLKKSLCWDSMIHSINIFEHLLCAKHSRKENKQINPLGVYLLIGNKQKANKYTKIYAGAKEAVKSNKGKGYAKMWGFK